MNSVIRLGTTYYASIRFVDGNSCIYHAETRENSPMNTPIRISIDELKRRMQSGEDFTIIDVRKHETWAESDTMIPESVRIPLDELEKSLARIPKNRPVVAYCT